MTYQIPAQTHRTTINVINSEFIATVGYASTVEEAKSFIAAVRAEMPDATHHVYAFRVGHGNSVIEGMSDDGEPSGTAGPPVLAVLRGSNLGDIVIVVTRYFGGTKLGTGGLVRAYSDAARTGLSTLKTEAKVARALLGIETSYSMYELIKLLVHKHEGEVTDETFAGDVTIIAQFPLDQIEPFSRALSELTAGRVQPVRLD